MKFICCLVIFSIMGLSGFSSASVEISNIDNQSTASKPSKATASKNGFYIGFDYMNLSDYHIKWTDTDNVTGKQRSGTDVFGYHIGTVGFALGYTDTTGSGIGFKVGSRFLETLNPSETRNWITSKFYIVIPEVNLTYALNTFLTPYLGLSYSVFNGSSATNDFRGRIGGQFGLGVHVAKQLTLNLGYSVLVQALKLQDDLGGYGSYGMSSELQASGFNTNLVYIF